MKNISKSIGEPPAMNTRLCDSIDVPSLKTVIKAYGAIRNPLLTSKTKENSFQTLNRTLWTNNKAFKSKIVDSPACAYCNEIETMDHMLYLCPNYSALQWQMLGEVLTEHCKNFDPEMGNIVITYKNIIFNVEIQALPRSLPSKNTRKMVQVLIHEVRRDIYARRSAHPPQTATPVPEVRRIAHLLSSINKLASYFKYISESQWEPAQAALSDFLRILCEKIP